ncbi:thermonuclease family protein [Actinoallomurus vinaceus]|uniref:Thermonuclease family protein n=1 Tax=Actinoallomurus vinaceus TaxID=1080074 RepID=A0ABP8UQ98_9ACTN
MRRWTLVGAGILTALCGAHATGADRVLGTPWPLDRPETSHASGRMPGDDGATATVVRVVDGDTLILRIGGRARRVRLIGADAPEIWTRRDCFGAEAFRGLRRLAPIGSEVRVAGDHEPSDRFGRRLLYVWTRDGRLVAAELIRAGLARLLVIPPDTRYAPLLGAAEADARRTRAGLWRACR